MEFVSTKNEKDFTIEGHLVEFEITDGQIRKVLISKNNIPIVAISKGDYSAMLVLIPKPVKTEILYTVKGFLQSDKDVEVSYSNRDKRKVSEFIKEQLDNSIITNITETKVPVSND